MSKLKFRDFESVQGHTAGRQWGQELCIEGMSTLPVGLLFFFKLKYNRPTIFYYFQVSI